MAMQSTYDIGCDDLEDESEAIDICAHCAFGEKFQPALYFCFDCGVFGRCMCGDCNRWHKKFANKHVVRSLSSSADLTSRHSDSSKLQEEIDRLKRDLEGITRQYNEATSDIKNKDNKAKEVEDQYKLYVKRSENLQLENSRLQDEIKQLTKDLEDFQGKYDEVSYRKKQTDDKANETEQQHKLLVKHTEELTKRKNKLEEENKRLTSENYKLQEEIKMLTKDSEYLKGQTISSMQKKELEIEHLHKVNFKQTKKLTKQKDKLEEENKRTEEPSFRVEQTDMQDQEPPDKKVIDIRSHVFREDIEWSIVRAFNGSKIMKTQIKHILRKQQRLESSKELMSCKEKFEVGFNESQEAMNEILNAFTSEQVSGGQVGRTKSRSGASWKKPDIPLECMGSIKKDKTIEEITKQLKQSEETLKQVFHMRNKLEEEIQRLEDQTAELNQRWRTEKENNRRLEEQIALLKQQCQTERDMKDDALRRLSAMESSKLRDNNPNITDLSDQNRPTKIAERLSELYDNQWTDAFDALQNDRKQDETIIQELLKMLMDVFNECSRLAKDRFFQKVQDSIEFPVERKVRNRPVELPDQLIQQVKEFRRVRATKVIREIQEVVLENLGLVNQPNDIQSYLAYCVEIGWFAAVQDPPLALMGKSPDRFDTNVFKDYTQRGPYVEYVVWPALLLHENGPMLAKGVAQGCSVKPTNLRQTSYTAKRQNTDATGLSTPTKTVFSPPRCPARNSARGTQITRPTLYIKSSNAPNKEGDL